MNPKNVSASLFAQWLREADKNVDGTGVPYVRFYEENGDVRAQYLAYAEHCVAQVDPSDWPGCILERMEREVGRGDEVSIAASLLQPWGWPQYPKIPGMDSFTHIAIPAGTRGVVVSENELTVTVDYVVGDTLYRTSVERQYVRRIK